METLPTSSEPRRGLTGEWEKESGLHGCAFTFCFCLTNVPKLRSSKQRTFLISQYVCHRKVQLCHCQALCSGSQIKESAGALISAEAQGLLPSTCGCWQNSLPCSFMTDMPALLLLSARTAPSSYRLLPGPSHSPLRGSSQHGFLKGSWRAPLTL